MGTDFLAAAVAWPKGKTLDWEAGKAAVATIPEDQLASALEEVLGEAGETRAEMEEQAWEVIVDAEAAFKEEDYENFSFRGWNIAVSGGMSGGDAPTDWCDRVWALYRLPEAVMAAIGFEMDWSGEG